jgi:hypothetical protein
MTSKLRKDGRSVKRRNHAAFPFYLKESRGSSINAWFAQELAAKTKKSGLSEKDLGLAKTLESGEFPLTVGALHEFVQRVYGSELLVMLEDVYTKKKEAIDRFGHFSGDGYYAYISETKKRRKQKPKHLFVSAFISDAREPTPMLFGGVSGQFRWAIPLRKLNDQPMHVDFLELGAKKTTGTGRGKTGPHTNIGHEVIFVIHGRVSVRFYDERDHTFGPPPLQKNEFVQFPGERRHDIENVSPNTTALLLVIRSFPSGRQSGN